MRHWALLVVAAVVAVLVILFSSNGTGPSVGGPDGGVGTRTNSSSIATGPRATDSEENSRSRTNREPSGGPDLQGEQGADPVVLVDGVVPTDPVQHMHWQLSRNRLFNGAKRLRGYSLEVEEAVRNPSLNPNGKSLSESQRQSLELLLRPFNDRIDELVNREIRMRGEALQRAVEDGRYDNVPSAGNDLETLKVLEERMRLLEGRFGKRMEEIVYVVISSPPTVTPTSQTILFAARPHEPELFALRDVMDSEMRARFEAVRQFFLGIQ